MKKIKFFTLGIGLFSLFAYQSCQKDSTLVSDNSVSPSKISGTAPISQNPFNFVGVIHNQTLRELGNNPNFGTMTNSDRFQFVQNAMNIAFGLNLSSNYLEYEDLILSSEDNATKYEMWANKDFQTGVYDSDIREYVVRINQLISDSQLNHLDTNLVYSEMRVIENEIILQYGMPQNTAIDNRMLDLRTNQDKSTYLLIGASIAKHSFAFWGDAYYNPNNPWSDYGTLSNPFQRAWRWIKKAGADVGGFFSDPEHSAADGQLGHKWSWSLSKAITNAKAASAKI